MSVLSSHSHAIAESVTSFESKISALDGEIAVLKITDHHAQHLSFLLRLRSEYTEILKRCEGLSEACSALSDKLASRQR